MNNASQGTIRMLDIRWILLSALGLVGMAVGVAQRLALRTYGTSPGSWIMSCTAAFALGFPGGSLAADLLFGGLQSAIGFTTFLGVAV